MVPMRASASGALSQESDQQHVAAAAAARKASANCTSSDNSAEKECTTPSKPSQRSRKAGARARGEAACMLTVLSQGGGNVEASRNRRQRHDDRGAVGRRDEDPAAGKVLRLDLVQVGTLGCKRIGSHPAVQSPDVLNKRGRHCRFDSALQRKECTGGVRVSV
jgi:hypothetical protein